MSDNFIQTGVAENSQTPQVTLTSVAAHSAIVVFLADGSTTTPTGTSVSDAQGTYTARGSPVTDTTNTSWIQAYVLENADAGTHVINGASSEFADMVCVEIGTTGGTGTYADAKGANQISPGAGANALSSGTLTISAAATIVALMVDVSTTSTADEPTAGTSPIAFASRANQAYSGLGAGRLETGAASGNAAATGGPVIAGDNFITVAVAILNASPAGAGVATTGAVLPGGLNALGTGLTRAILPAGLGNMG